jgi:acetyl esterase/lipase
MIPRTLLVGLAAVLLLVSSSAPLAAAGSLPSPPAQAIDGPGGSSVAYPGVQSTQHDAGPTGYWLLVPTDNDDQPVLDEHLPLVIFLHGFSAVDPASYGAWLNHLVQRGAIVIYPTYQAADAFVSGTEQYLTNAETGIRAAVGLLSADAPDAIDPARVALAGHSVGGWLAAQYALAAADQRLPVPTALMSLMPGGCELCGSVAAVLRIPSGLDGTLDPDTRALVFEVASDPVVGTGASDRIWRALSQLPTNQRDRLVLSSDDHGSPALVAGHNTPETIGAGQPDAYDYGAIWRVFDALMSCAFDGTDCDVALGGGSAQSAIGDWSDGVPVAPLRESDGTP